MWTAIGRIAHLFAEPSSLPFRHIANKDYAQRTRNPVGVAAIRREPPSCRVPSGVDAQLAPPAAAGAGMQGSGRTRATGRRERFLTPLFAGIRFRGIRFGIGMLPITYLSH